MDRCIERALIKNDVAILENGTTHFLPRQRYRLLENAVPHNIGDGKSNEEATSSSTLGAMEVRVNT